MSILERDCVLVSKDESGNTIIDMPVTRVNNVEGLGRNPGTAYSVGDVVMCSGSKQLQLICTTAGTTSTADLDISANNADDTINDGTVTWIVAKRNHFNNSGILSVSEGGTGANNASQACANLGALPTSGGTMTGDIYNPNNSIIAKILRANDIDIYQDPNIVNSLIFRSNSQRDFGKTNNGCFIDVSNFFVDNPSEILTTLKVKDYASEVYFYGINWYIRFASGLIVQGGTQIGNGQYGVSTVTFITPFKVAVLGVFGTLNVGAETSFYTSNNTTWSKSSTDFSACITNMTLTNFQLQSCSSHHWLAIGI